MLSKILVVNTLLTDALFLILFCNDVNTDDLTTSAVKFRLTNC